MAIGRGVRLTVRVVVVVFLLSTAAVPAASVIGTPATTFDERATMADDRFAGDALSERASGDSLLTFQPADSTASAGVDSPLGMAVGEHVEHTVQHGVGTLSEATELLPSLAVLGYSRYDGSDPLANDRRATVYETITASPGIYLSKLSEETAIHRSTVRYHVRVLEEEGLIAEKLLQGKHRLYPVEQRERSLIAALDEEATAGVLQALLRLEPASVSALATDLDRAPSTVSHHLTRLAEDELVIRERDGNTVLTNLSQHVREAMQSTV